MDHSEAIAEELGAMGFFILALIGRMRLTSLYAFRQDAALEPGGIRSAMEHLEKKELITRTEPGRRKRRDLALTPAGREVVERYWTKCLRDFADAESVLRAACVVQIMDCPEYAAEYLKEPGRRAPGKGN
jgi:DNA-binding MarR family transcriptional regulator